MDRTQSLRGPRLLLLVTVTATAVVFLAPQAEAAAGLTVTKTASPADGTTVAPGDTVTYTVLVSNAGPDPATGLTVTDAVPPGTTYFPDSAMVDGVPVLGPSNPFEAGYALSDLAAATSHTISLQVTVSSPLSNGSTITNTSSASSPDDPASPLQDSTVHTVVSAPSLTVSKTAQPPEGGQVAPGDVITYTVVVGNDPSAGDDATAVSVADQVPANTTYMLDSATEDGTTVPGPTNPFESGYTLSDPTLSPGEQRTLTFQVLVDNPLPGGTAITNTATADATNSSPVTDGADHTVASAPGLTIDKTSDPIEGGTVAPGQTITYTITVANDPLATGTASSVVFTDATPTDATYVADSATLDAAPIPGPTNPFESGYGLPDMAPGEQHVVSYQALVAAPLDNGTTITNTASLESDQGSVSDDAVHTVQSQAALSLEKTATPAEGGPVTPGTSITYSLIVANAAEGTEVADQLVLTDPVPASTTYVAGSATVDGTAVSGEENPLGSGLALPNLAPGESTTVTFEVKVNAPLASGTVIANVATLAAENHPDLTDEATHTVDSAPVMKVDVAASPTAGSTVKSGQGITYTVTVSNDKAATTSLLAAVVSETPPQGSKYDPNSAKLDVAPATGSGAAAATADPANQALILGIGGGGPGETKLLNDGIWWELAHNVSARSALSMYPNVLSTMLPLDSQLVDDKPPGHPMWLFSLTPAEIQALGTANPEISRVVAAALADYAANRMPFEDALADYQVDLGLQPTISRELAAWREDVGITHGGLLTWAETASYDETFLRGTLPPAVPSSAAATDGGDGTPLGDIPPGQSRSATFTVVVGRSAEGELTNTATVTAGNHPTVVATTTHMAPEGSEDDGRNRGDGGGSGDSSAIALGMTTSEGAETLAFTGLDLARLLLLAMSLLLAGWVVLRRGREIQQRAVVPSTEAPAPPMPESRYTPRTWFFLPPE